MEIVTQLKKQLTSFEDACKILGLDAEKVVPDFSNYPEADKKAMIAHAKLVIIAKAANQLANDGKEHKPDWNDGKLNKYYPWFYMGGSLGFRYYGCADWDSFSDVGSRLCLKSSELAEYAGKQFTDLYQKFMITNN